MYDDYCLNWHLNIKNALAHASINNDNNEKTCYEINNVSISCILG